MASGLHHRDDEHPMAAVGQFIYVVDALILVAIGAVFVLSGLSPFESPVMTVVFLVCLAIVVVHHLWWVRNRDAIEHDTQMRHDRERRGF